MRHYLLTILFLAISFCSFGQNGQLIHGQVFDNKKHPLKGAVISNYAGEQMCVTDANGQFSTNSTVYSHTITVSCDGFNSAVVKVDGSYLIIKLRPSAVVIENQRMTKDERTEVEQQARTERDAADESVEMERKAITKAENQTERDDNAVVTDSVESCQYAVEDAKTGDSLAYEYVDLGLSVKWATCNVGADNPEDYGDYYAWGEMTPKSSYTKDNSNTYGKSIDEIGGDILYDVATVNEGSDWRLPTQDEFNELIINCKWKWTTYNGVKGYEVKSKKNGNSIFLPAAGYCNGDVPSRQGSVGYYWSSTPGGVNNAGSLYFYAGNYEMGQRVRYYGRSVRPVTK